MSKKRRNTEYEEFECETPVEDENAIYAEFEYEPNNSERSGGYYGDFEG